MKLRLVKVNIFVPFSFSASWFPRQIFPQVALGDLCIICLNISIFSRHFLFSVTFLIHSGAMVARQAVAVV
jgi:hypothetical protein